MEVKKVIVIFKTHLDIGFTDFSRNVTERYMNSFLPDAVRTAAFLRESGRKERMIWTTGSWLISEYLRTHTGAEREAVCRGIEQGDIRWHGLPFTTHTELMNAELFEYGLSLSRELDRAFGKKTIGAKMTDVPGHTKAIIPYMRKYGIEFLHIGVNPASTVPEVPDLFRWKCDSGEMINVMYQKDYGLFSRIGNSGTAVYFAHTGDNHGVQSPEEILKIFESLKEKMPHAEIVAGDLNDLALAVRQIEAELPVVTEEIGDTWIHGIGTDPKKVSQFRALERLYETISDKKDKEVLARGLLMIPEHTWGLDEKTHLGDHQHFNRSEWEQIRKAGQNYLKMEASWREQREYLANTVSRLSECTRKEALKCLKEAVRESVVTEGGRKVESGERISLQDFVIRFNKQGEIDWLEKSGKVLADEKHRWMSLCYEQFCEDDYKRFYSQYDRQDFDWSREDFTKIGMHTGVDCYRRYEPEPAEVYSFPDKIVVTYVFPKQAYLEWGCPEKFDLILSLEDDALLFDLAWFRKPANRIAEAIWVGFHPIAEGKRVRKLGQSIDPKNVVKKGQCRLHGTDYGVTYKNLSLESLDTALVALQEPSLLNFCDIKPLDEQGIYFNLYNNVWGTNFPMWYEEDARFRFLCRSVDTSFGNGCEA